MASYGKKAANKVEHAPTRPRPAPGVVGEMATTAPGHPSDDLQRTGDWLDEIITPAADAAGVSVDTSAPTDNRKMRSVQTRRGQR